MSAQRSLLWQSGVGDGGPYTDEELRLYADILGLSIGANVGVVPGQLNELAVTSTGNNDIRVATGRAIPDGTAYENDALLIFNTASPVVGTTGRRVVLQKDWTARTIRAAIITSADGTPGLPALTQTDGVTWEIPLASFTITTGGVIGALTDEREYTVSAIPARSYPSRAGQTRWSIPGWWYAAVQTASAALVADIIYFTPILIQEVRTFDRIGTRVTTLAAGESTRVGLYNARLDADGLVPTSLIAEGKLSVAVAGPTDVEQVISEELRPGWYFLAQVTESNTPRFQGPQVTSAISLPVTGLAESSNLVADEVILLTTVDAGADYVNNGLPDPAIAVTDLDSSSVLAACVNLRDSS